MPSSINKQLREQGLERQEVTLSLRFESREVKHYCLFCPSRKPLFMAHGRVFAVMFGYNAGDNVLIIPVGIQCPECGAIYKIVGISA